MELGVVDRGVETGLGDGGVQRGDGVCDCCDEIVQRLHAHIITTGCYMVGRVAYTSTANLGTSGRLLLRPENIDESLVLVEEPAFAKFVVFDSVQEHALHALRRITKVFGDNQCSE